MTRVTAHDVAGELRRQVLGIPIKKLHKLLYYCQGHHLAHTGRPLFGESIMAWDMGPVVAALWKAEKDGVLPGTREQLEVAELNTVAYVVSRYGRLTGADLERLTHNEPPWRDADAHRDPGGTVRITRESMRAFFLHDEVEADEVSPTDEAIAQWLGDAGARRDERRPPDSAEEIQRRLASLG